MYTIQGPTLACEQLRLSSWLVTLVSRPPSNYLTSDSLSSQLERWPPSNHICKLSQELPQRGTGGGQVTVLARLVKINHFFIFFAQNFSVENDVLGTILRCSPLREPTLQLGRVASALVDSPQQSVDSTWWETCLLLLTVCSCLFIPMFYKLCCPCEHNVCHDGNTLLDTEEITLVVLRMNR